MAGSTLQSSVPEVIDRFADPLYTVVEAARYLAVPTSTLAAWSRRYRRQTPGRPAVVGAPVLTTIDGVGTEGPSIPFIGLAEGAVLSAIRRSGVPLQRIRPALAALSQELGIQHALASRRLFTDGAEVLFDFSTRIRDHDLGAAAGELVVVRKGQRVFNEVVDAYLRRVEFAADDYASLIRLSAYRRAEVVVDVGRGFGQPLFARGGARLDDVLSMFRAGEPVDVVAEEYGLTREDVEDAIRVATQTAA